MKAAYVILIVIALGFVVWDILTQNFDIYFYLMAGVLIALTFALLAHEKRELRL